MIDILNTYDLITTTIYLSPVILFTILIRGQTAKTGTVRTAGLIGFEILSLLYSQNSDLEHHNIQHTQTSAQRKGLVNTHRSDFFFFFNISLLEWNGPTQKHCIPHNEKVIRYTWSEQKDTNNFYTVNWRNLHRLGRIKIFTFFLNFVCMHLK